MRNRAPARGAGLCHCAAAAARARPAPTGGQPTTHPGVTGAKPLKGREGQGRRGRRGRNTPPGRPRAKTLPTDPLRLAPTTHPLFPWNKGVTIHMDRLRVTPSRHHTHDRLYVHRPDGTTLAWYDRDSGHVSLLDSASRDAVLHSLTPFLAGPTVVPPPACAPTPAAAP